MQAPAKDDSPHDNEPLCEAMGQLAIATDLDDAKNPYKAIMGIEIAFQELSPAAFGTASLRALRATCRAFRDLIDTSESLISAKFSRGSNVAGFDALAVWAQGGPWMPRTRSLAIRGEMTRHLANQILGNITLRTPPLSRIKLERVGPGGEALELLKAPLEHLRELNVKHANGGNHESFFMSFIGRNTSLGGLRSLSIDRCTFRVNTLAAALVHLSELKSLSIAYTNILTDADDPVPLEAFSGCLEALEVLRLSECHSGRVGLLGAWGPPMPALRNLRLRFFRDELEPRPWLRMLTKLHVKGTSVAPWRSGSA